LTTTVSTDTPSSGNPALSDRVVSKYLVPDGATRTMSFGGVSAKTAVFLALLIAGGAWGWASATESVSADAGSGYANTTVTIPGGFWLASFGAFFLGIFAVFNPKRAALFGVGYALLEGYVLGAISAAFEAQTEGIVGAAITATVCVFLVALFLYATRIIRPTARMAFGVTAAIGGLALLYLFVWVIAIFDWEWLYSEQFQTIGLVVSVLAVILAALSLTLDFGVIEDGVRSGAPKYMEWYSAYALMVTVVWLYISLLRVLAFLARER
jgi:uncharacterized YccA/Bax inhibitor family protein